jgi:aminomethyltransferase
VLKETPFHPRTSALVEGAAWRRWAGYSMASVYELTHEREYHAVRSSAALFDVTPLYKYLIRGRDAARLLDRIVTRDVGKAKVGQVLYTPWCDGRGKVIDDGTVSRLDETTFRMTSADPNIRWLHLNASGLECTIEDVSERVAALSLQGPLSRAILEHATEQDLAGLKYFRLTTAKISGVTVTISRTGYTGDLGFEIWVEAPRALPVWDALIESGSDYGITPAGLLALDLVRNEAGLLLIDVDYVSAHHALIESQMSTPYELSLGWTVALQKDRFNGRDALVTEHARGPAWRFMGVEVDWDALERLYADVGLPPKLPTTAWRASVPLYVGGVQVGYATSGCWSPLLKRYIALAHLEGPYGEPDTVVEMEVTVEHRRKRAGATVRALPFFNPARKRA